MDVSYPVAERNPKRSKTCFNDVDKFSILPDPILHHILALVGAKQGVKMSVLSKRWKNIWASIPNLCFDDQDFLFTLGKERRIHAYTKFVDAELNRHAKSNILQFRFWWRYGFDNNITYRLVQHSIDCDAQELDLYIPKHPPHDDKLLQLLCSCSSLQVLILHVPMDRPPLLAGFSRLKTLLLASVNSPNESFGEQLIDCFALQKLSLYSCSFKSIQISSVSLESFASHNSKVSDQDIKVSTPHLLSFEYTTCYELDACCFENLSSLVSAKIGILRNCKEGDKVSDILKWLYNVRELTFISFNLQCERNKENFLNCLPTFMNLRHLEMMEAPAKAMKAVKEILQHSPNLENLRISKRKGAKKSREPHMKQLKRLRTVVIDGFGGTNSERGLLNYLERNAGVVKNKKAILSFNG